MNENNTKIITLIFILFFSFNLFSNIPTTIAEEILVDQNGSGDYTDLYQALTNATANDIITIKNGSYPIKDAEKLIIDIPITIKGTNKHQTIIKQIQYDNLIEITSDHVTLKNLTLQGQFLSIITLKANHTSLDTLIFNVTGYADAISSDNTQKKNIYIHNVSAQQKNCLFNKIINLYITNSSFSTTIFQHIINATITNCFFINGQTSIDQQTQYTTFQNCTFADYQYTQFLMNGKYNIIHSSHFQNIGPDGNAVNLDGTNNQIIGCTFTKNTNGINVFNINNTISKNNFINHENAAVIAAPSWVGENNTINIDNNWWGNKTGPYHKNLNPDGLGDTVLENVNFSTWLNESIPYTPLENKPEYTPPPEENPHQTKPNQNQGEDNDENLIQYELFIPIIVGILVILALILKKR